MLGTMRTAPGCLALLVLGFILLLPFFVANAMLAALSKLGLAPGSALVVTLGIFLGGMINIPIRKIPREQVVEVPMVSLFGLPRVAPQLVRQRTFTIIAVNVGGCLVPCALGVYELVRLAEAGTGPLMAGLAAVAISTAVCFWLAKPVPNVGITMPALVPALVAALCALVLAREHAPPVAFIAGVLGTLIGADLLHLREVQRTHTGVASIGGAGTFDGIVLSGLVATLLA